MGRGRGSGGPSEEVRRNFPGLCRGRLRGVRDAGLLPSRKPGRCQCHVECWRQYRVGNRSELGQHAHGNAHARLGGRAGDAHGNRILHGLRDARGLGDQRLPDYRQGRPRGRCRSAGRACGKGRERLCVREGDRLLDWRGGRSHGDYRGLAASHHPRAGRGRQAVLRHLRERQSAGERQRLPRHRRAPA